jgi:hypothetical protein
MMLNCCENQLLSVINAEATTGRNIGVSEPSLKMALSAMTSVEWTPYKAALNGLICKKLVGARLGHHRGKGRSPVPTRYFIPRLWMEN